MSFSIVIVLGTFILTAWVFALLWTRRVHFHSLSPFLFGAGFLFIGRVLSAGAEIPGLSTLRMFNLPQASTTMGLMMIGDVAEVVGVLFLVLGFIRTIEFLEKTEKDIRTLESLLPICAWCKKIRLDSGAWKPIEEYLKTTAGRQLTHGVCPDCVERMKEDYNQLRQA